MVILNRKREWRLHSDVQPPFYTPKEGENVKNDEIKLLRGNCLELAEQIPDGSIDMVLCDPPYGVTDCRWDSVLPFDAMWRM